MGAGARRHARTKTRIHYASLYDHHIAPHLGGTALRELRHENIARWQARSPRRGAARVAVRHSLDLLGDILQHAVDSERIAANPARRVRKARPPRRREVRPLAPATIEAVRRAADARDATLIAVLAYAGLRPSEALALQWGDIRTNTIRVELALALGEDHDTKTTQHRTVRLLVPLRGEAVACGRPPGGARLPEPSGRRVVAGGVSVVAPARLPPRGRGPGVTHATLYALRHSSASLILHEGRSVIYVARQLGHDARLTLTRDGHVIDEPDEQPRIDAETAIRDASVPAVPGAPGATDSIRT